MKKDELRPVKYLKPQGISIPDTNQIDTDKPRTPFESPWDNPQNILDGYFHLWQKIVIEDSDESYYGLIETTDGKMINVYYESFMFADRN